MFLPEVASSAVTYSPLGIRNIFLQSSIVGIAAVGQAFVILTGAIDVSLYGIGVLASVLGASVLTSRYDLNLVGGDPYGDGRELNALGEAVKVATALMSDPVKFRQRARVALDKLASMPQVDSSRLAAIGYCMGGTFSLELARSRRRASGPCGSF